MKKVFLDYASATPLDKGVLDAMLPYFSDLFYNPSSSHLLSKEIKLEINEARKNVANIIGAKHNEIVFVSGGSEANNLAIKGIMDLHKQANMLYGATEHDSVIQPAKNYHSKEIKVDTLGNIDLADLKKKIDDKTVLISVMHVNNEIGTINNLAKIAEIVNEHRYLRNEKGSALPLYLHCDASQSPNYLAVNVARMGVDLLTLNGGKIYGPKQSGILYVNSKVNIKPLIEGGGQEYGLRSGTTSAASIIGFAEALVLTEKMRKSEENRVESLRNHLIKELLKNKKVSLNGPTKNRIANNVHITIDGMDNETLMYKLDDFGFMVAVGSACSASSEEPSHVLKAVGLSDAQARQSIRITLGRQTTKDNVDNFIKEISGLIK